MPKHHFIPLYFIPDNVRYTSWSSIWVVGAISVAMVENSLGHLRWKLLSQEITTPSISMTRHGLVFLTSECTDTCNRQVCCGIALLLSLVLCHCSQFPFLYRFPCPTPLLSCPIASPNQCLPGTSSVFRIDAAAKWKPLLVRSVSSFCFVCFYIQNCYSICKIPSTNFSCLAFLVTWVLNFYFWIRLDHKSPCPEEKAVLF